MSRHPFVSKNKRGWSRVPIEVRWVGLMPVELRFQIGWRPLRNDVGALSDKLLHLRV